MKPPFPENAITKFPPNSEHFFLSNFYPSIVPFEGLTYISAEHAYQAAKSLDPKVRRLIFEQPTAAAAKKMGQVINIRPDWNQVKAQVMEQILREKFHKDGGQAEKLLETKDALLIEGNYWHDLYWGQCFCKRHNWEGTNVLGELLMKLRAEMSNNASQGSSTSS
jgi:ribA/ribD-fused uncharacterized protein